MLCSYPAGHELDSVDVKTVGNGWLILVWSHASHFPVTFTDRPTIKIAHWSLRRCQSWPAMGSLDLQAMCAIAMEAALNAKVLHTMSDPKHLLYLPAAGSSSHLQQ